MSEFATVQDVETIWRLLTTEEIEKVKVLLPLVSDVIMHEGAKVGVDAYEEAQMNASFASVAKLVTVAAVKRYMNESDESGQMSRMTQSALGYSITGTFVAAGGGIKLLNNELKQLGFKRQKYGVMELYEY